MWMLILIKNLKLEREEKEERGLYKELKLIYRA